MGTLNDFDSLGIASTSGRDSQIFGHDKAPWTDTVLQLPLLDDFGSYRQDVCCGRPWQELPKWQQQEEKALDDDKK
jgi:hypothetical protein